MQMIEGLAGHADQGTYDQVPHEDAYQAYSSAQQQLSPQQFNQAAQQYYEQASPEQRAEMAQQFQQISQQTGDYQGQYFDPQSVSAQQLAGMHQQAQQNNPDMMHQLFSPGGMMSSPAAKAAVGGIAAFAAKQLLSRGI